MANLSRWDPGRRSMSLREAMDRLFEDSFIGLSNWAPLSGIEGNLAVDVYETKDDIVVKASLPGVNPDDIEINVQGDMLTIRGEMKEEQETEEENYHRRERRYGAYVRTLQLPSSVAIDRAEAICDNGILTLRLPKVEEAKPRTIQVKWGNGEKRQQVEGKSRTTK